MVRGILTLHNDTHGDHEAPEDGHGIGPDGLPDSHGPLGLDGLSGQRVISCEPVVIVVISEAASRVVRGK